MSSPLDSTNTIDETPRNYPFLVQHIPKETLDKDESSSSSRQKRRRTSPQDHALLETTYQRNSKPDKLERLAIVSQVALGEKEVQIWFQNRRQNDRRKSRPLLPHELVPHFRNGVPLEVLQHSPQVKGEIGSHPPSAYVSGKETKGDTRTHSRASSIHELLNCSSSSESTLSTTAPGTQEHLETDASSFSSIEQAGNHGHPKRAYMAADPTSGQNCSITSTRKRAHEEMTNPADVAANHTAKLASQSSMVRLSMTAEGAVKIRTSDSDTPSPPKGRASPLDVTSRRSNTLERSKSAVGATEMGAQTSPLLALPKAGDGKLGRSRDARTWEFYCDSEARDSLSSHAEHERNGSAVGAINLIRSQSQRQLRQMLAPQASQSNARAPAPPGSNGQRVKPKLARAKSSLARLQGADAELTESINKAPGSQLIRSPSGDSDKENWAPGTHASQNPLRRTHGSSNSRPVLSDSLGMLTYASKLDGNDNGNVRRIDGKENRIAPSMKEKGSDLDCVQGLLSLSQGAWR